MQPPCLFRALLFQVGMSAAATSNRLINRPMLLMMEMAPGRSQERGKATGSNEAAIMAALFFSLTNQVVILVLSPVYSDVAVYPREPIGPVNIT